MRRRRADSFFADDFVILCNSEDAARGALARMVTLLGEQGLELNPEKTGIVPFDQVERPNSAVLTQTVRRAPPPWRRSLDKRMIKHEPPEYTVASVGLFRKSN